MQKQQICITHLGEDYHEPREVQMPRLCIGDWVKVQLHMCTSDWPIASQTQMYIPLPILITELNSEYFSFASWYTADFALSVEGTGSTWQDAELLFLHPVFSSHQVATWYRVSAGSRSWSGLSLCPTVDSLLRTPKVWINCNSGLGNMNIFSQWGLDLNPRGWVILDWILSWMFYVIPKGSDYSIYAIPEFFRVICSH